MFYENSRFGLVYFLFGRQETDGEKLSGMRYDNFWVVHFSNGAQGFAKQCLGAIICLLIAGLLT